MADRDNRAYLRTLVDFAGDTLGLLSPTEVVEVVVRLMWQHLPPEEWQRAINRISRNLKIAEEDNGVIFDNDALLRHYDRLVAKRGIKIAEFARLIAAGYKRDGINGVGARSQDVKRLDPFIRALLRERRRKRKG